MKHLHQFVLLTFFYFLSYSTMGQTRPDSDGNTQQSGTCLGCTISNAIQARDASSTTFATFDVTGLPVGILGFLSRDYNFSSNLSIDEEITIDFQFSDNSLLASLGTNVATAIIFDRLQIELLDGTNSIATYGGNGLLSNLATVDVLNPSTGSFQVIIKVPANNVNKICIKTGALVSLGAGVSPSNLLVYDIRSSITNRYYASRFTGNSGQVGASLLSCISCGVTQEALATTYLSDPNLEYARYRWDLGLTLLGSEYQFAEFDWGASPNYNFLGDQDGIPDALVLTLQESNVADLGLSDLGLNLWNSGGIELFVTYTDLTTETYNNLSNFLTAKVLGRHSGRFDIIFHIPSSKTVDQIEVRRVAPTAGLFSELRLYSIYSIPNDLLPLELEAFDAVQHKNCVQLNWSTQQKDIDYFEIEHSTDAIEFTSLGVVAATSASLYTFTDNQPVPAHNYYRLKVIDEYEEVQYSPIKNVHFNVPNSYHIYAQQNQLFIKNNTPITEKAIITIMDLNGRVVKQLIQNKEERLTIVDCSTLGQLFAIRIKNSQGQFTKLISIVE